MKRLRNPNSYRTATVAFAFVIIVGLVIFIFPELKSDAGSANFRKSKATNPPIRPVDHANISKTRLEQLTNDLPLAFEANQGQVDLSVKFLLRGNGSNLLLTPDRAVLQSAQSSFAFKFLGANAAAPRGVEQLPGRRNYFLGNQPADWHTDVPTFRKVIYENINPGINLSFHGNQRELEYDFEVSPGADPRAIRLAFDRGVQLSLSESGDLLLRRHRDRVVERKPHIYQEIDGERRTIEGNYTLLPHRGVGFQIGDYDPSKPLVIDPTVIYSTYLGGSGDD